jgi:hypothetical protein
VAKGVHFRRCLRVGPFNLAGLVMKHVQESGLQFKVAGPPGLVEPRLERAIET